VAFTKIISKEHHKALYSPIVILALMLFLSGLISAYPDRICYPLSTGPLCFNSTSISGLSLSGIDYYNKSEIDEQQLAQNITLSGYYNNLSNFTGSMEASKYCVYNGSAIECNATGASGISWISFNTSGLLGGNITSSGTVGLNLSYLNVLYNDSVLISTVNNVTAQNVTAWGFFNNVANSSFIIDSANVSGWGFYYNLSNFSGSLIAGKWCAYNGSKFECNITPVIDTDTNAETLCSGLTTYLSGEGGCNDLDLAYWNSCDDADSAGCGWIDSNTISSYYYNLSNFTGSMIADNWCAYNGTHIVCNITPVTQVSGASGGISSANISGYGFKQFDNVLNITGNVTFENLTLTKNLSTANISIGANGYIWLNGVGILTWAEVNGSLFSTITLGTTSITDWSYVNWSNNQLSGSLNMTANITFENLTIMRNLSAGNITVNASGYLSIGGIRVIDWSQVNRTYGQSLNMTGNVTFENLTIMRNLSAGNITVNGSGYFSLGGVRVLSWAEINQSSLLDIRNIKAENDWMMYYSNTVGIVELPLNTGSGSFLRSNGEAAPTWIYLYNITSDNITKWGFYNSVANSSFIINDSNVSGWGFQQFNQNLNTTNNVTFNNVTFTGGFINASSSKWKIGNYESNGNFSGTCYNGSVVYIGSNYALSTVGC